MNELFSYSRNILVRQFATLINLLKRNNFNLSHSQEYYFEYNSLQKFQSLAREHFKFIFYYFFFNIPTIYV